MLQQIQWDLCMHPSSWRAGGCHHVIAARGLGQVDPAALTSTAYLQQKRILDQQPTTQTRHVAAAGFLVKTSKNAIAFNCQKGSNTQSSQDEIDCDIECPANAPVSCAKRECSCLMVFKDCVTWWTSTFCEYIHAQKLGFRS